MAIETNFTAAMEAEARSIQAPGISGARIFTNPNSGEWKYLDLTAFVGRYISVVTAAQALDYCMVPSASAVPVSTGRTAMDSGTASILPANSRDDFIVPAARPILALRSNGGTGGNVSIRRA